MSANQRVGGALLRKRFLEASAASDRRSGYCPKLPIVSVSFSLVLRWRAREKAYLTMFFCCVFFFRGFHPRLETLNCYAVPEERFASVILLLRVLCELAREISSAAETAANQRGEAVVLRKSFFLVPARRPRQAPSRGRFRLRHFVIHTTNVSCSLLLPTAYCLHSRVL